MMIQFENYVLWSLLRWLNFRSMMYFWTLRKLHFMT